MPVNRVWCVSFLIPFQFAILDLILDGIGQVFFMGSPLVGAFFLAGLAINSWRAAVAASIGSIVGGATGLALGVPYDTIIFGIYGFNSVLTAIALGDTFLEKGMITWIVTIIGSIFTGIMTASGIWFTARFGLPVETSAFVASTWIFLFAAHRLRLMNFATTSNIPRQRLTLLKREESSSDHRILKFKDFSTCGFVKLVFTGIAQVMFQENWITGVIFFVGLTLATVPFSGSIAFGIQYPIYFAGVTSFLASLVGTATAIAFRADKIDILRGVYGFNAVLTGLATMGVFLGFLWPFQGFPGAPIMFLIMIFASFISVFVTAWLGSITSRWNIPTLTGPFVLTSWFFELAYHELPAIVGNSIPAVIFKAVATGLCIVALGTHPMWWISFEIA